MGARLRFRHVVVLLAAASVWLSATPVEASSASWRIQRLGGRDYLPVTQIANFYQMRVMPHGDRVSLSSAARRMDFAKGSREARIDGVKHWLSFPVLYFAGQFYVSRMDLAKTIDPVMRPHRIPGLKPVRTVVLDPGHGGHDRGAVNRWGSEKNYNLDVSRRVRAYLQKAGLRVVITRRGDEFIPLEQRPAVANRLGEGTIFVSIHFNAAGTRYSPATGFEVFSLTPRGAPNSHDAFLTRRSFALEKGHANDHASHILATAIQHAKLGRVPMFDRGVKRARFAVLRHAAVPAVLVEGGFLTNPHDARKLHSEKWRERLAESIAMGILEFAKLAGGGERPRWLAEYRAVEAAAIAGTEFDYQPLAGIGRSLRPRFPGLRGWRRFQPASPGEELPPFRLEYEPAGWVQLELWAAAGEDARSTGGGAQSYSMRAREWPDPAPPWPGLRGWRSFLPPGPFADESFVLFPVRPGAPVVGE